MRIYASSKGNALFLILIAVALFAALSYAVTQSGRGSGSIDREQQEIDTAEIIQYVGQIQHAIQRLVLVSGCTVGNGGNLDPYDGTISFDSPSWGSFIYDNVNAPGDNSCHVFDQAGGGIPWKRPPTSIQSMGGTEYIITGELGINGVGTTGQADGYSSELILISWVTENMCVQINKKLGITNPSGVPPEINVGAGLYGLPLLGFKAIGRGFVDAAVLGNGGGLAPELFGQQMGCFSNVGDAQDYFYFVLWPR
ncbi:MAG: hypothetical protein OXT65_00110 [Alphaproteobacteria bacterium]|nr:hypothetical protein [Alphaproteobacteria bacterium]